MKNLINLVVIAVFIFGCTSPKLKQQNNVKVSRITFESSKCSSQCPSFQLQIDSSKRILYNGLAFVEKKGYYAGGIDRGFWNYLVDKIHYVDLKHMKSQYGQNPDDNQTLKLRIETDKGIYRCNILESDRTPAALHDLVHHILSNYRKIELKPLDIDSMFKLNSSPRRKALNDVLEKIPC